MVFRNVIAFILVAATTLPAAWYHGHVTNRWSDNEMIEFHSRELPLVPRKFDQWRVVDEGQPLDQYVIDELGVHAHFNRIYENDTGDRVTALVMVGEAGPLVRHPIEICYGNRAKKLVNSVDLSIGDSDPPQQFNIRRYEPKSVLEDEFYVAYAFCYDNSWQIPTVPRYEYGGKPVLYKMQVLTNAGDTPERESPAYLIDFIEKFSNVVWRQP